MKRKRREDEFVEQLATEVDTTSAKIVRNIVEILYEDVCHKDSSLMAPMISVVGGRLIANGMQNMIDWQGDEYARQWLASTVEMLGKEIGYVVGKEVKIQIVVIDKK